MRLVPAVLQIRVLSDGCMCYDCAYPMGFVCQIESALSMIITCARRLHWVLDLHVQWNLQVYDVCMLYGCACPEISIYFGICVSYGFACPMGFYICYDCACPMGFCIAYGIFIFSDSCMFYDFAFAMMLHVL